MATIYRYKTGTEVLVKLQKNRFQF